MAEPIANLIPSEYFDDLKWPGVVAAMLIAAASFVVVPIAKLGILDCTIDEYSRSISLMGVGVE